VYSGPNRSDSVFDVRSWGDPERLRPVEEDVERVTRLALADVGPLVREDRVTVLDGREVSG
jgi:hypothetical protein